MVPLGAERSCTCGGDDLAHGGRDPRAIRRLLNIGQLPGAPTEQADVLAGLALESGTSVFIIPGDDPDAMAAFAVDVVPAVREAVAVARA